jgi:hypothetical protein
MFYSAFLFSPAEGGFAKKSEQAGIGSGVLEAARTAEQA